MVSVVTVFADNFPDNEKQVMVFTVDNDIGFNVGVNQGEVPISFTIDIFSNYCKPVDLYRKIVYEATYINDFNSLYREAITVGDHIPIAA